MPPLLGGIILKIARWQSSDPIDRRPNRCRQIGACGPDGMLNSHQRCIAAFRGERIQDLDAKQSE